VSSHAVLSLVAADGTAPPVLGEGHGTGPEALSVSIGSRSALMKTEF